MNVFSVRVRMEGLDETTEMYRQTISNFAANFLEFRGMLGLVDRETGDVLSIALNEKESSIHDARSSGLNLDEIHKYEHLFLTPPIRDVYRVEVRYMPMNRPFPGEAALFARATTGWVRPTDVEKTIRRNRDSLVFAAIYEKGCCGFLLCANHNTGKIFGISLWDTDENLRRSEGEHGYYYREMAKNQDLLLKPFERQTYEVFARLLSG